jgi:deoxyribose-phosphate aldolase
MKNLAKYLDFANHHPDATEDDIRFLCEKVIEYGFNSAFVNQTHVPLARSLMVDKGKVGSIVAFPLGEELLSSKIAEAKDTAGAGADELDISLNVSFIKEKKWDELFTEMKKLTEVVKTAGEKKLVKFILETGYLTKEEIQKTSRLIVESGADFVKTNSGMGPRGASLEDVAVIRQAIGDEFKIKVAGGISTYDQAVEFINAGANRIGTSKAIEIVKGLNSNQNLSQKE